MITIQVAGCTCTVDQAERSYSTLLSQIAANRTEGSVTALNAGHEGGGDAAWWVNFMRTDVGRAMYNRLQPEAVAQREAHETARTDDTSFTRRRTSSDLFIWKLAFEEAFAASNMEWVEGRNPYAASWSELLPVPGYLAYDVFGAKVPVRATERILAYSATHPTSATNLVLAQVGLRSREGLGQTEEGLTEWQLLSRNWIARGQDWFDRLGAQVNTPVVQDAPVEPNWYGFESLEECKAALRFLIISARHTDGRSWCLSDTNEVLQGLEITPSDVPGEREAIATYIEQFARVVERHNGSGMVLEQLKQWKQPAQVLVSDSITTTEAGAAIVEGMAAGIQEAQGTVAPDPLTELCTPIRVRDFLIELSEQTGNEGVVNEWLDQLGLAPYNRRYEASMRILVRVDANTPAQATEILRRAQWSTTESDSIDVDDIGVTEIRLR